MGGAVLVARLLLAGVFVTAAVGKLLDLPGSRRALLDFGVGRSLARVGAIGLPILELATAVALLVQPSAVWGAAAAVVLLAAFTVGIVRALARGDAPDCHCFGTLHSAPAGSSQIVRNALLAALAGFVIVAGPSTAIAATEGGASEAVALVLGFSAFSLLVVSVHLWGERRRLRAQVGDLREAVAAVPPGLAVGALAPGFTARDADGNRFTLDDLRSRGQPVALIFGAPGCGPCSALAPELPRWRAAVADSLTLGLVGIDTYLRYEDAAAQNGGATVHEVYEWDPELAAEADELNAVFATYRIRATPSAVLVTPEGTIASATVDGRPAIKALIGLAVDRRGAPGLQAAPALASGPRRAVHV